MSITSRQIKSLALDTGFDACGITNINISPHPNPLPKGEGKFPASPAGGQAGGEGMLVAEESYLKEWIRQGKHGGMHYLEEYPERQKKFFKEFPDAKNVIVLGVNYWTGGATVGANPCPTAGEAGVRPSPDKKRGQVLMPLYQNLSPFFDDSSTGQTHGSAPTNMVPSGRVARYAWGKDYHKIISEKLNKLIGKIKNVVAANRHACSLQTKNIHLETCVDTKPLLERSLAVEAGLGFIGRQSQLISPEFGPWLFLAEIVTNLQLEPDRPIEGNCGRCRKCIDQCPTGAIGENKSMDARKCIAYLTIEHKNEIPEELKPKIGDRIFGCDRCLEVCPYTSKQKETRWKEFKATSGAGSRLDLNELLAIKTNREYKEKFSDSAISRATRRQLLRNASIVIENFRK